MEHATPLALSETHLLEDEQYEAVLQYAEHAPLHDVAHSPLLPQSYCPQPFSGSVPAGRFLQVPMLPEMLQARHGPVQLELQHTPSTQLPLLHSQELPQVAPFALSDMHFPAEQ